LWKLKDLSAHDCQLHEEKLTRTGWVLEIGAIDVGAKTAYFRIDPEHLLFVVASRNVDLNHSYPAHGAEEAKRD